MEVITVFLLFSLPALGTAYSDPHDVAALTHDLFVRKGRRTVATLSCTDYESRRLAKALMKQGLWVVQTRSLEDVDRTRLGIPHHVLGVLIQLECAANKKYLMESSERGFLTRNSSWLVWSHEPPAHSLSLRVDTDLTWAMPHAGMVSLFDMFQIIHYLPLSISHVGSWSLQTGLKYRVGRRTLQGIVLKAGVVVTKMPFDHIHERLRSSQDRHLDTISKQNYGIILHMKDILHFKIVPVPVHTWGYLKNGTYDGLIGMMQTGDVQIAVTSFIFKTNRMDVIDYTGPTYRYRSFLMFRHPPAQGVPDAMLKPFSPGTWVSASLLMMLVVVLMRIITRCEGRYMGKGLDTSWGAAAMFAISMATLQGMDVNFHWLSGRMLVLSAAILAVFVDAYYAGAIVSSLLLPHPITIRTLKDLIESPLAVGLENLGYNWDYLEKSTDPIIARLKKKKRPKSYPLLAGVEKVAKERFAFQSEIVSMYPLLEKALDESGKCALTGVIFQPHSMTFNAVPKDSPLRELFFFGLRQVWETGLLQYEQKMWTPQRPSCSQRVEGVSLGLEPLSPAFLLLLISIVGSLVLVAVERLCPSVVAAKTKKESVLPKLTI